MSRPPSPPRLARALAILVLRGQAREVIVGDLDEEFAEGIAAGVRPAAARRLYWRQTLASIVAVVREARKDPRMISSHRARLLGGLSLDLKSVLRALRRSPGYPALAVVSLTIGIGANITMFSVVRQLFLTPLTVERPDELRLVYWTPRSNAPLGILNFSATSTRDATGTNYRSNVSYRQFMALRNSTSGLAELAGYNFLRRLTLSTDGGTPVITSGLMASGNFFGVLRPPIAIGRGLIEADDVIGAPLVTVISHGLWSRLFASDPAALGKSIRINGNIAQIVGVMAAPYRGLSPGGFSPVEDVVVPLAAQPLVSAEWSSSGRGLFDEPTAYWVRIIARMTPATERPAHEALQAALPRVLLEGGMKREIATSAGIGVFPAARGLDTLRTSAQLPLRILAAVVGVVLLIGCLNVSGLMLARGVWRQRDLAVRRALGAGRGRIVREVLLESGILCVAGGVAGLVVALWMAPALQSLISAGLGTSGISVVLDWPLVGAAAALSCLAAMMAGLVPALLFSRHHTSLLAARSGTAGAPKLRIGRALLACQIAVSLPLVVGAGLFLRTLHNLGQVNLGFDPRGLALFTVDPTMNGSAPDRTATVFPRLLERLEAIPGVASATVLQTALIAGDSSYAGVTIDGQKALIDMNVVGPHFMESMGIRLVAGRPLLESDTAQAPPVVVVNESAARRHFGGGASALGRRLTWLSHEFEVVGVAADSKYGDLRTDIQPAMLMSYLQRTAIGPRVSSMIVAVRSGLPPAELRVAVDAALRDVAPGIPITDYRTQEEQIEQTVRRERIFSRSLTAFGVFTLLLACVGIHGMTSYSVARRTGEIGIRLALGASRPQVLWMVFRQLLVPVGAGLVIGLPIAWLVSPVARTFLFELHPRDPVTIGAAAAIIVVVAVVAGVRPARRAARMQALAALRSD